MKNIYILSCAKSGGIYHYLFDNGKFELVQKTPLDRPMYATIRENKMYVVLREVDEVTHFGGLISFNLDEEGRLINPSEIQSTNGLVPCHLAVSEYGIYVANYISGNVTKIGGKTITHSGKGTHPVRQDSPHMHFAGVSPDGEQVFCVDLGIDRIFVYDRDLCEKHVIKLPDGCGPRHLAFSENERYIYCVTELSSEVCVIKDFELKSMVSAVPHYTDETIAAAIRLKDGYLYVSNRGADTITCFRIAGDTLELLENTPCGGVWPRDFEIVEDYIICTNEKSNSVTVLKSENGKMKLMDEKLEMECPLCVLKEEEI